MRPTSSTPASAWRRGVQRGRAEGARRRRAIDAAMWLCRRVTMSSAFAVRPGQEEPVSEPVQLAGHAEPRDAVEWFARMFDETALAGWLTGVLAVAVNGAAGGAA